ncbi:hypothetical protein IMG5_060490, partial [Ichthyophthirius multifiliis]
TLQISPDNDENTQGRIIQIGTNLFLFDKIFHSTKSIQHLNLRLSADLKKETFCPTSYQIINQQDLQTILNHKDKLKIFNEYLQIKIADGEKLIVCTNTKLTAVISNGGENSDWEFQCAQLDSSINGNINAVNTYWEKKPMITFCKKVDSTNVNVELSGYNGYDFIEGQKYKLNIINKQNVIKYYSEDSQGNQYTTQNIEYTANKTHQYGCSYIKLKVLLFGNFISNRCVVFWMSPKYGSNQDTKLTYGQIIKVRLNGIQSTFNRGLHFSPSCFSLSPLLNENASWAFYQDNASKNLIVQKINADGTLNGSSININQQGQPMDITSLPNGGFAILAKNGDKCWIASYDNNGTQAWNIILHDNGDNPTVVRQQISFLNAQGQQPFGMENMYKPYNGKLLYARGRLFIAWAYYNHFGMDSKGARNDHTGSTMFSMDYITSNQRLLYFSFNPTHSLNQELYYDGRFVYFGSLGDAYPQNVKIKLCETYAAQCYEFQDKIDLVNDNEMPSNGSGKAGGRFGGITKKIGINQKQVLYQRKEQKTNSDFLPKLINHVNEVSLQLIEPQIIDKKFSLNKVSRVQLLTGDLGKRANVIKSVNYGKNILILFNLVDQAGDINTFNKDFTQDNDECYIMLVNSNDGSKILEETKIPDSISANDLMRVLQDGRVVYTQVNKDNSVDYFYTPIPPPNIYPDVIVQNDPIYGYGATLLKGQTQPVAITVDNDTTQKPSSGLIQIVHFGLFFLIGLLCFEF